MRPRGLRHCFWLCTSLAALGVAGCARPPAAERASHETGTTPATANPNATTEALRPPSLAAQPTVGVVAAGAAHEQGAVDKQGAVGEPGGAAPTLPAPTRTRTGSLRFAEPAIEDPRMAAVLLARLSDTRLDSAQRAALVEALPRTGGVWQQAIVERYVQERDPAVRQMMVAIMRRAGSPFDEQCTLLGLVDTDPSVRAEAATTASLLKRRLGPESELAQALTRALTDPAVAVRASAARSLGVLGNAPSFAPIARLLDDPAADVRLHALGALQRLDAPKARSLRVVLSLVHDADARVARAAQALLN